MFYGLSISHICGSLVSHLARKSAHDTTSKYRVSDGFDYPLKLLYGSSPSALRQVMHVA